VGKVAFIGLGVMGYPMAGHLSRGGHEVTVFNRTRSKVDSWLDEHDGACAPTPRLAATAAEVVFGCVGNDDDLRAVTQGPTGAFAGMAPGSVYVDHSTTSDAVARELAELGAEGGIEFIDAPVSGGQSGAEKGMLTVMCGGRECSFEQVRPFIDCYARACVLMGPTGTGQLTKMVNQVCIAGLLQGLAEGLNFGMAAGLDMEKVIAVLSKGAAQSWQMDNRASTMLAGEFDFGFAVDWMRKDLGIVLDCARRNGAQLPLTTIVDQFYGRLQDRGANRCDTSSLITLLEGPAGA
jgi:3-hydroxyisobutyrate dehydrogenase